MCPPQKRNVPHFTFLSVTLPFLFDFGHLGTQKKLCIPNRSYFIYIWAFLVTQTEKNQTEKNLPAVREDLGSIPGSGRPPGEGNGYPLQQDICHEVTKGWTQLSTTFTLSLFLVIYIYRNICLQILPFRFRYFPLREIYPNNLV